MRCIRRAIRNRWFAASSWPLLPSPCCPSAAAARVACYFIIPLTASLGWLAWRGADLLAAIAMMADPLMMLAIAMIASELFYRTRRQQVELERELRALASVDALTGLHNRRDLEQRIAAEVSRSRRHGRPLSVAIGDLDHFK